MATERIGRAVLELATEGFAAVRGDLSAIRTDVGKIGQTADLVSSGLSKIGTSLAAAFTIGAIGKVVGDFVEMSGALVDLEAKTGISVTGLQRLKLATQESGVELDTVAKSATALQKRLGEGKDSFIAALDAVGLNYKTIRELSPEDALFAVGDALGKITDQNDKVFLGNELLGKQVTELLPALNGKLKETADAYERMGLVIDEDVIRAGDKLGDQWTVLKSLGASLLAQVLSPTIPVLSDLAAAVTKVADTGTPIAKWALEQIGLPFDHAIHLARDLGEAFDLLRLKGANLPGLPSNQPKPPESPKEEPLPPPVDLSKAPDMLSKLGVAAGVATLNLDQMRNAEDGLTESAKESIKSHEKAAQALEREAEAAKRFRAAWSGEDAFNAARKLTDQIAELGGAQTLTAEQQRRALATLQDAIDKYDALGQQAPADVLAVTMQLDAMVTQLKDATSHVELLGLSFDKNLQPPPIFSTFDPIKSIAPLKGAVLEQGTGIGAGLGGQMLHGLQQTFANQFGPTIIAALTGGGNVGQSIGGLLGQSLTSSLTGFLSKSAPNFMKSFLGQALGSFLPGFGALLGPLLGKLFGGPSKAVLEARQKLVDFRKDLEASATATEKNEAAMSGWGDAGALTLIRVRNALQTLGRSGDEANAIVKDLLNTDNPAKMAAAMRQVTDIMDQAKDKAAAAAEEIERQKQAFEDAKQGAHDLVDQLSTLVENSGLLPAGLDGYISRLKAAGLLTDEDAEKLAGLKDVADRVTFDKANAAVEMFGGNVENLGPAFNQLRIDKTAGEYVDAIEAMIRASGDVGGALTIAKGKLGELVAESIRTKATLPAQLEPFIKNLRDTHQLLDENGEEITDLKDLKFGPPIKTEADIARESFEKFLAKIDELIAKITGPLQQAVDNLDTDKTINVKVNYQDPGYRPPTGGEYHGEGEPIPFDVGTPGRLGSLFGDFKNGRLARLHGVEAVLTPAQLDRLLSVRMPPAPDPSDIRTRLEESTDRYEKLVEGVAKAISTTLQGVRPLFIAVDGRGADADEIRERIFREMPQEIAFDRNGLRVALTELLGA